MADDEHTANSMNPEKMTNAELHAHFTKLFVGRAQDVDTRFADTMEKIDGLEAAFNTKLDTKF
jgi:hypothetical protein